MAPVLNPVEVKHPVVWNGLIPFFLTLMSNGTSAQYCTQVEAQVAAAVLQIKATNTSSQFLKSIQPVTVPIVPDVRVNVLVVLLTELNGNLRYSKVLAGSHGSCILSTPQHGVHGANGVIQHIPAVTTTVVSAA